jgi:hypothetical protein
VKQQDDLPVIQALVDVMEPDLARVRDGNLSIVGFERVAREVIESFVWGSQDVQGTPPFRVNQSLSPAPTGAAIRLPCEASGHCQASLYRHDG